MEPHLRVLVSSQPVDPVSWGPMGQAASGCIRDALSPFTSCPDGNGKYKWADHTLCSPACPGGHPRRTDLDLGLWPRNSVGHRGQLGFVRGWGGRRVVGGWTGTWTGEMREGTEGTGPLSSPGSPPAQAQLQVRALCHRLCPARGPPLMPLSPGGRYGCATTQTGARAPAAVGEPCVITTTSAGSGLCQRPCPRSVSGSTR